jgi:hypothetical protein
MIYLHYSGKPSLTLRKLKIPHPSRGVGDERQTVAKNEHFDIVYDPDKGIFFKFLQEDIDIALTEIKHRLKVAKLPIEFESGSESLLSVEEWSMMSGLERKSLELHGIEIVPFKPEEVQPHDHLDLIIDGFNFHFLHKQYDTIDELKGQLQWFSDWMKKIKNKTEGQ